MHAMYGRPVCLKQPGRDSFVGQQHELLDQLVGNVVRHPFNTSHAALFIEADLHLGEIQFQRARLEPQPPDALREFVRVMQHSLNGARWRALQNLEGLAIAETALRMNHRGISPGLQHAAVLRDEELHALRQAIHVRLERTELVAQCLRQHRDDAVHQVGGVAAPPRLVIERGSRLHIVRYVRNVNPELPVILGNSVEADGVVEVLGIVGIDGDDLMTPAILAPGNFTGAHLAADGARLIQDLLGEMQREVVLAQHGEHVHALFVGRTQHLHHFALRIRVPRFPRAQFDHHLVSGGRPAPDVARLRHVNVVRDAWVIGNHVEKARAAMERADDPRAMPLKHLQDASGGLDLLARAWRPEWNITTHQHMIFVHGRPGGALRNGDFLQR